MTLATSRPYRILSVVGSLGFGGDENRLISVAESFDPREFSLSVLVLPEPDNYERHFGSLFQVLRQLWEELLDNLLKNGKANGAMSLKLRFGSERAR